MSPLLRRVCCALAVAGAFAGGTVAAQADPTGTTVYVNTGGQDVPTCGTSPYFTCASIQYAIDNRATDGTTVQVAAGNYAGTVSITKGITLTGVGMPTIDGSGQDLSTPGAYAVVSIGAADAAITVSGFQITGASGALPAGSTQVGVQVSGSTAATTISGNTITASSGVSALGGTASTPTTISGNTITATNGIDVDAGTASPSVTVTGNTITAGAADGTGGSAGAAAIALNADAGGTLAVGLGGNTGRVSAPTATVAETGAGAITVTPTAQPDTIALAVAPTFTFGTPDVLVPNASPVAQIPSTVASSVATLPQARVDVAFTSTTSADASQVYLSNGFTPITLSGSTAGGAAITGSLDPSTGSALSPNASRNYDLNLNVTVPYGPLTVTFTLDEVSRGADPGDPVVLNTVATSSHTATVRNNRAPVVPAQSVAVAYNTGKAITLAATDPDGDAISYALAQTTTTSGGTVTQQVSGNPGVTYQPKAGFVGADSFAFTASDDYGGSTTGTVSLTVAAAVPTITVTISPTAPNASQAPTAVVSVTSAGSLAGASVTVSPVNRTAALSNGRASVQLVHYTGGSHTISVTLSRTATTQAQTVSKTFTVTKVTPTVTVTTTPSQLTTKTTTGKAIVTLTALGLSVSGVPVTIKEGTRTIGTATMSANRATVALPALSIGQHNWTVVYPGTSTTNAATKAVAVRVALG